MPLITMREVAETLGVSRAHVRNLAHRGVLDFYRVGLRMMFDQADVDRFLEAARNAPAARPR